MESLFTSIQEAYIGATNSAGLLQYFQLSTIAQGGFGVNLNLTVANWLAGYTGLPALPWVTASKPTVNFQHTLFTDATQAAYTRIRVAPTGDPTLPNPIGAKTDLLLSRPLTDPTLVNEYCLTTVNGLLHYSSILPNYGIRITDGGRSVEVCNKNHVGLISFKNIGSIQQIPITAAMIQQPEPYMNLANEAYINLGVSLVGKTVLMSIGGYLHVLDTTYSVVNPVTGYIKVRLKAIDMLYRLFEQQSILNLSSLGLTVDPVNPKAVYLPDLQNPTILTNYLTMSQTFAIVLNGTGIYTARNRIQYGTLPGLYIAFSEPQYIMQGTSGSLLEYVSTPDNGQYSLNVEDNTSPNYLYLTTDWTRNQWIAPTIDMSNPRLPRMVDLVDIGQELINVIPL